MTTSHLPRRAVVGAVLAASIVGGGLVAAQADESGGGCPATYTDPAGDAAPGDPALAPALGDADLDIVAITHSVDAGQFSSIVKVAKLTNVGPDAASGDIYTVNFTVGGKAVAMKALRDLSGSPFAGSEIVASTSVGGTKQSFVTKAVFDVKASTVAISASVADLTKAIGKDLTGLPFSAMSADTRSDYGMSNSPSPQALAPRYDQATAGTTNAYVFGSSCGGGSVGASGAPKAPASAPTDAPPAAGPAPSGGGDPSKLPTADCFLAKDPKGDGHVVNANVPNDPDLDITGLTIGSDSSTMYSYIKVDKLGAGPSNSTDGHRYYLNFTFNKHAFTAAGSAYKNASSGQVRDGLAGSGQISHVTQLSMDGSTGTPGYVASTLKFVFDQKNSVVIISVPLADLEKAAKAPAAGAVLTGVYAGSYADTDALAEGADFLPDGATASAPGKLTYTVGDSSCFGAATSAAAGPLTSTGATRAQYGDSAAVAAKLVDASGAPVAGKAVTFTLGSSTATGTTGADGVAKAALPVKNKAGKRSLVLTSGDAKTAVDFTVLVEKTIVRATGSRGSVTATLTDDDKSPVAGQVITFASGSRKVSARTDAKGVAKASGLPAGNVKVSYAGAAGMYTAARTSAKA